MPTNDNHLYALKADLPGVTPAEIKVRIEEGILNIEGMLLSKKKNR
jgi:HSP20 family molecular chaperone IbpA